MKFLKLITICLSIFAVVLIGTVLYIKLADPDIIVMNNRSNTLASPPVIHNNLDTTVKQKSLEPSTEPAAAPSSILPEPSNVVPTSNQPEPSEAVPSSSPKPNKVQPTPDPPSGSNELSIPAPSSKSDPSTLIIGRWKVATKPKVCIEFFQDGTFTKGTYHGKKDYNEFSGTYSFSSNSRLKLQYEKWTIELPSGYKNTRADDLSHVFNITIEGNELVIPDGVEVFGETVLVKVN
ncbi:hypothetical protein P4H66_07745 [Paenibacillus dokdonensis]|uniref:Uncharacterized protein n=1 Tax=Paenibacillus dokdonensis TaxID=2567944 RepID=A0ABU6GJ19_9BACL|nr:hypothetical protein [Paenibacillus dokdonensis]MEC0239750.1 hypothetical protein [Paenibacillus dokdonensis]